MSRTTASDHLERALDIACHLKHALSLIDVPLADYIIVGGQ